MTRRIRNWGAGTPALALFAMLVLNAPGLARAQAQVNGQWTTRSEIMTINAVHAGLLRTGNVLVIAGSGNDPKETVYKAAVWDPVAGTIDVQNMAWDVWCNGMSFLPDGRAFITGGSKPYPTNNFRGLKNTTIFDPETSSFSRADDMTDGRWYPTNVALPDGRTATFSGYGEDGKPNRTFEIYTPGSGWSPENPNGWPASLQNYPRAHLTPQGDLFFSGWQIDSHRFDPATLTWKRNVAKTLYGATRSYGSSVLLGLRPPAYNARILIAGGGTGYEATLAAEVIDLSESAPQWRQTGFLNHKRVQHNSVLLPNGQVLAVGGSARNNVAEGGGRISELYDPETGQWTDMAQQAYWRFYHSTALLLPDGRVASLGGNPKQGLYERHIEIYSPSYLYTSSGAPAPRPTVTGVPAQIGYALPFEVTTAVPGERETKEAVLMRPGATTHAFDMEQRLVELEIAALPGGKLRLVGPPNANIAPPGYYMLFVIDSAGVPSVARFLRVSDSAAPPPPPPPPPPSGNLLSNPGFESDATGWSGASGRVVTGTVHSGLKALQVKALKSGVVLVSRQLAIEPGARYSAAVWAKTTDPYAAGAIVQTQFLNSAGTPVSTVNVGTVTGTQDWRQLQRIVTAPSTAAKVRFKLLGLKEPDGVATAYFDDASLNKL